MEDPDVVYEREVDEEWERSAESLSEVLIHNALLEVVWTAPYRQWSTMADDTLLEVLAPMTEVTFGGWRWYNNPFCRIFMSDTLIATVDPIRDLRNQEFDQPGYTDAQVAATNPTHLAYLDEVPQLGWRRRP
ncbi:hypothetical protein ACFW3D_13615 [Streptomyces sp. NPDC058864]